MKISICEVRRFDVETMFQDGSAELRITKSAGGPFVSVSDYKLLFDELKTAHRTAANAAIAENPAVAGGDE